MQQWATIILKTSQYSCFGVIHAHGGNPLLSKPNEIIRLTFSRMLGLLLRSYSGGVEEV